MTQTVEKMPTENVRQISMEEWSFSITPYLEGIRMGANMAARNARMLVARPNFETLAEDDLQKAREAVTSALAAIEAAQAAYQGTEVAE